MALIGKASLIADIGNFVPGPQPLAGIVNSYDVQITSRRQPGVLLKSADQRLFTHVALMCQLIEGGRREQAGLQPFAQILAGGA